MPGCHLIILLSTHYGKPLAIIPILALKLPTASSELIQLSHIVETETEAQNINLATSVALRSLFLEDDESENSERPLAKIQGCLNPVIFLLLIGKFGRRWNLPLFLMQD